MGKKSKKKQKKPLFALPDAALRLQEKLALETGDFKRLVEIGKTLAGRGDNDAGFRLQGYYLSWAIELYKKNLVIEAGSILNNIAAPIENLALPADYEMIFNILVRTKKTSRALKLYDHLRNTISSADSVDGALSELMIKLDIRIADLMILDSEVEHGIVNGKSLSFTDDLMHIKEGMLMLEKGDERAMQESLRSIALKSPFRFWKLLLKGISLFFRDKDEEAKEILRKVPPETVAAVPAAVFLTIMKGEAGGKPESLEFEWLLPFKRLLDCTRKSLSPEKAMILDHMPRIINSLTYRKYQEAFAISQKLISSTAISRVEKGRFGALLWNLLLGSPENIPAAFLENFPSLGHYFPDSNHLDRLKALQAERQGLFEEARRHWMRIAEYMEKNGHIWFAEKHRKCAIARVLHRAVQCKKEDLEDFAGKVMLLRSDREFIENTLEKAIRLDRSHRPLYEEAISIFQGEKNDKPKLAKWVRRLREAFPDDDEALFSSIELDIECDSLFKAKKDISILWERENKTEELTSKLGVDTTKLARKFYDKKIYEEARAILGDLVSRQEGDRAEFTRLKLGCMETALGRHSLGKKLIEESISKLKYQATGYLAAAVEMKRFKAPKNYSEIYRMGLTRLMSEGKVSSPVDLVRYHNEVFKYVSYPDNAQEVRVIAEFLSRHPIEEYSEADMLLISIYLSSFDSEKEGRAWIEKAFVRFPGSPRIKYLHFVHSDCDNRPRTLTEKEKNNLEEWAELLRQRGDLGFAQEITHFLNICRHIESEPGFLPDEEYFSLEPDELPFDFDGLPPMGFPGRKGGERLDREVDMMLQYFSSIAKSLPEVDNPRFESELRKMIKRLGLPPEPEFYWLIRNMRQVESHFGDGFDFYEFLKSIPGTHGSPQKRKKRRKRSAKNSYDEEDIPF